MTVPPSATPPAFPIDALAARLQVALGDAYLVEDRLGAGGFAVVYGVRDLQLKRRLAVKVLSPDLISSHSTLERFRREAETVARLSHPHIVPLHFIGQKDDLVYLVMQAIEGGSLADRLAREPRLSIEEVSRILGEVASALAYAHANGVVHRDIKPQNILLVADSGRAVVTDFGIARTAEGESLTATGLTIGTPTYLSPEQVTGDSFDHRADIYALGVMGYEMLAGEPPFNAPTQAAVLMKRLAGPPPPLRTVRTDVPEYLENLVQASLTVDPNERIQNAADIHRAIISSNYTSARVRPTADITRIPPRRGVWVAVITGLLAVAATVVLWLQLSRESTPSPGVAPIDSGMVLIAGGTYTIGNNDVAGARPAHPVQLSSFGLGRREVTVAEYRAYIEAVRMPAPWVSQPDASLPVTGVRYAEAENYCRWRHPDGGRLPTEAEWEAAARGFEGRPYPWGREWRSDAANIDSVRGVPVPVGNYSSGSSPEGVDDLIGNVWEWTSSPYAPYGDSTTAPTGMYVIRGGGYNTLREFSNAVFRGRADPAADRTNLAATGFRCAMSVR